jgi:hypothetical protein
VANAILAVKAACGSSDPFSGAQTISVYATGGPYTALGDTWRLLPTASYPLLITAAPGESPVINCGGSTANVFDLVSSYTTFTGFEITACGSIYSDADEGNVTISYNYIHDIATGGFGAINPNAHETNWWVHHNRIVNAPIGIVVGGNALIEYNEVGATTAASSAVQISCGTLGTPCTIRNNIAYGTGPTAPIGQAIWQFSAATVTGNVSYYANTGLDVGGSSDMVTWSNNIAAFAGSGYTCLCEIGSAGACNININHTLCLKGEGTYLGPVTLESNAASSQSFTSSISWADSTLNAYSRNLNLEFVRSIYSDYNVFNKTGSLATAYASDGVTYYNSLSDWQATGNDAHTVQTDPRFLGDVNLLNTPARLFPECLTIECRLAKIRHNYTPTNLALKGTGCAWNGTACAPDHSDIGPVPVTVYDAPGITGGGVY